MEVIFLISADWKDSLKIILPSIPDAHLMIVFFIIGYPFFWKKN